MKKLIAVMMVALLPGLALADEVAHKNNPEQQRSNLKPTVSVVALSAEKAQEFAELRSEYQTQKVLLDMEYETRLDAILAKPAEFNF